MADSPRLEKFINYTKEAFFAPFHLATLGVITAASIAGSLLAYNAGTAFDPSIFLLLGAGTELALLGLISRNERFVRAVNAKYGDKIQEYNKTKALVDYYNKLSSNAQQRFDKLRQNIKEVRDRYAKVGISSSGMVDSFLLKLNAIELNYVRLIYLKDKFPEIANDKVVYDTQREMDTLNQELKQVSGKLKEVKEKRLKLLDMKMQNFGKIRENKEIVEERLQTMEDMVEYIKDQPMTMMQSDKDDVMIDNILFDAEQTQESLAEIESLMQSEFSYGGYDDLGSGTVGNKVRE